MIQKLCRWINLLYTGIVGHTVWSATRNSRPHGKFINFPSIMVGHSVLYPYHWAQTCKRGLSWILSPSTPTRSWQEANFFTLPQQKVDRRQLILDRTQTVKLIFDRSQTVTLPTKIHNFVEDFNLISEKFSVKFTSKLSILYKSFICKQNKLHHAGGSTWLILYLFLNNILLIDSRLFYYDRWTFLVAV